MCCYTTDSGMVRSISLAYRGHRGKHCLDDANLGLNRLAPIVRTHFAFAWRKPELLVSRVFSRVFSSAGRRLRTSPTTTEQKKHRESTPKLGGECDEIAEREQGERAC